MRGVSGFSIRTKLFAGFGLMIVLLALVAATAYRGITAVQESQRNLSEREFVDALEMKEIRSNQAAARSKVFAMIVLPRGSSQEALHSDIDRKSVV